MAFKNLSKMIVGKCLKRSYTAGAKFVSVNVNDKTGYATLEMQRPPVNSLNTELLTNISSVLQECETNNCRGLILTSKSDGVFSAGLDILEMYKPNPDRVRNFWSILQDTWIKLYGASYPTVSLINGHAPAGGCLLACSTEYRIMYSNCTIGLNETKLGIVAPFWFIDSFQNVIGFRQSELALTAGYMFKTDEALKVGLIDDVAENRNEGMSKAEAFLNKFTQVSPKARSITKSFIRRNFIEKLIKNKEEDLQMFLNSVQNPQVQKSLGVYLESLKKKSSNHS